MEEVDLIAIHMHHYPREVFRDIAEKDDSLRRQLKLALHEFHDPLEALLLIGNSDLVSPTSKTGNVRKGKDRGFSGTRVTLHSPSFSVSDIKHNSEVLEKFRMKETKTWDHSTHIRKDFGTESTIKLLIASKVQRRLPQVSFAALSEYLQKWDKGYRDGKFTNPVPESTSWSGPTGGSRGCSGLNDAPGSVEEALTTAKKRFDTIPRAADKNGDFRGDASWTATWTGTG